MQAMRGRHDKRSATAKDIAKAKERPQKLKGASQARRIEQGTPAPRPRCALRTPAAPFMAPKQSKLDLATPLPRSTAASCDPVPPALETAGRCLDPWPWQFRQKFVTKEELRVCIHEHMNSKVAAVEKYWAKQELRLDALREAWAFSGYLIEKDRVIATMRRKQAPPGVALAALFGMACKYACNAVDVKGIWEVMAPWGVATLLAHSRRPRAHRHVNWGPLGRRGRRAMPLLREFCQNRGRPSIASVVMAMGSDTNMAR